MAIASLAAFIDALRQSRLIEPSQLDPALAELQSRASDPKGFIQELIRRDLLTPFQANQIVQNGGRDLVLGPYILQAKIGEGVMGQLYKARHRLMNRLVALKVIRPELLAQPAAVEKFYHDTMAAGQLAHANIVHAYDSGPIGNTHFFAMEFVEGVDLERLVQQSGPLQVSVACDFIRQTALGLQHAFERGLLHRDVKPSNLIITRPGGGVTAGTASGSGPKGGPIVKIRNLGLTLLQPISEADLARVTGAGAQAKVPRTPDYLAPERIQAKHPGDVRSDMYSLGCTFYFALAGRVPYPGGTAQDKFRKHMSEEPVPLSALRRDVPPGVTAVISRLMAKRPEARFQTPAELAAALQTGG
ncbi:MAG: serine/threonine protein kinase [Gemmataceae bacterium]|nr:serine/threonine protein kinase [Gemmataceae bacterium]